MKVEDAIEQKFRNIDIEYQFVAYALRKSPYLVTSVSPDWMSVDPLRRVVNILKRLKATFPLKESLAHEMNREKIQGALKPAYIACVDRLYETDIKAVMDKNAFVLAKQLYDLYETRRVVSGLKSLFTGKASDFDLRRAKTLMRDLSQTVEIHSDKLTGEYLKDYERRVEMVKQKASQEEDASIGVLTGFESFDQLTGGLMPGEFGVVAGKPGIGKTAALISFAINAWLRDIPVLFASGEMSKDLIQFRIDSYLSRVSSTKFRTGTLDEDDWKRWQDTVNQFRLTQNDYLQISAFTRHFTVSEIESEIVRAQEEFGRAIGLVCIDYLNIMDPDRSMRNGESGKSWEGQADVVWDVKALTAEINGGIACWTAGQIKDEAFEKEFLELDDIKYSRSISETAPIVVGLVQTQEDMLEDRIQFQNLKMRNAARSDKSLYLYPNLDVMRIHDRISGGRKDLLALGDQEGPSRKEAKQDRKKRLI